MSAPRRRGACPGLSVPMPTGDGLLARLMPTGPVRLDAFRALCASARRHGNGTIEVTARGSLQVRGLSESSAPLFAAEVGRLAIDLQDGVPVLAGPLAGADVAPVDPAGIAAKLRRALRSSPLALSPKVSVVVDGCGGLHLDAVSADIRLRATEPRITAALSCRTGRRRRLRHLDRNRPAGIGRRCRHRAAGGHRGAWPGRARIRRASR